MTVPTASSMASVRPPCPSHGASSRSRRERPSDVSAAERFRHCRSGSEGRDRRGAIRVGREQAAETGAVEDLLDGVLRAAQMHVRRRGPAVDVVVDGAQGGEPVFGIRGRLAAA